MTTIQRGRTDRGARFPYEEENNEVENKRI